MADHLTVERRSENMRAVRGKDTEPELIVRRLLHAMGYRYRLRPRDLPGKPDIAFKGRRKAIFVHGCFWHGHDCRRGRRPSTNTAFWNKKLDRNRQRDTDQLRSLETLGWKSLVIWECEVAQPGLRQRLGAFLGP